MGAKYLLRLVFLLFGLCLACPAWGVVLHPDYEPDLATWLDRPPSAVVGRWGTNASCVAVAPNYVITTKHQGISVDANGVILTKVQLGSVTYTIDDYWDHPDVVDPPNPDYYRVDLRLAKLHAANLTEYVDVYSTFDEVAISDIVIGGYGVARGTSLEKFNKVYGYAWDDSNGNTVQRWGTNEIDSAETEHNYSNYSIDSLRGHFNDPGATDYECIGAEHDSGGGWFIYSAGKWYVAALTVTVEHIGESRFRNAANPNQPDPDQMDGIRLSSYAGWIYENMDICTETLQMDLNGDCIVDAEDLADFAAQWLRQGCSAANNYCQGADVIDTDSVNLADFAVFSSMWLENKLTP